MKRMLFLLMIVCGMSVAQGQTFEEGFSGEAEISNKSEFEKYWIYHHEVLNTGLKSLSKHLDVNCEIRNFEQTLCLI